MILDVLSNQKIAGFKMNLSNEMEWGVLPQRNFGRIGAGF